MPGTLAFPLRRAMMGKTFTAQMATPKGKRAVQFPVNAADAVHVYSDDEHIWLQLRREVPTEQDIGRPSFKVALCLQPGTATKLGLELMNVAERNKEKQKAKNVSAKQAQPKAKQSGTAPTSKKADISLTEPKPAKAAG